jgi:hypothetical protein
MARLTDEQVRHLTSDLIAQALTRMADDTPERSLVLKDALKAWVPEADEFDLREILPRVQVGLRGMATLVEERRERLVSTGKAAPYAR